MSDKEILEIIRKHADLRRADVYELNNRIKVFDVWLDEEKNREDFEIIERWFNEQK